MPRSTASLRRSFARLRAATLVLVLAATPLAAQAEERMTDRYPPGAAGWGPTLENGRFVSRWAEDWRPARAAGEAPRHKAMPLYPGAWLTLSSETRLRVDARDGAQSRGRARSISGLDLRLAPGFRVYAEAGSGSVMGPRDAASASDQNDAALQQSFAECRSEAGAVLLGGMFGRQEFADGPRQLLSVGDGANLHRTWNGVRLFAQGARVRVGAFDLRATGLARGAFDESLRRGERLRGVTAGTVVADGAAGTTLYTDPFWYHTERADARVGAASGRDARDTWGARLWGRGGRVTLDWTLARQSGRFAERDVNAWALFAVQSVALGAGERAPRLGVRVDAASGGGTFTSGTVRGFQPLYASSGYLGEGQLLGASNLLLVTPSVSVAPVRGAELTAEYGFARRLDERDAAYAGAMRAYAGTEAVGGHALGGLLRVRGEWAATSTVSLQFDVEHLDSGTVLRRAHAAPGAYGYVGATYRY